MLNIIAQHKLSLKVGTSMQVENAALHVDKDCYTVLSRIGTRVQKIFLINGISGGLGNPVIA